jgi:mannose-6-phosphate isomerase
MKAGSPDGFCAEPSRRDQALGFSEIMPEVPAQPNSPIPAKTTGEAGTAARKLSTSFHERVWGSTKLAPLFENRRDKIGEVWLETVPGLPLLIKFIFTSEALSVQVHPDDAYAQKHHQSLGKTEMWHILAAEPGAGIAAGFREPVTPERAREAAQSGEIEHLLEWHSAQAGDTFFIPAGTVHAIGAGLTLCEIQEHSDVTYRLYDYGRPRELHLEHGLRVSRLTPVAVRAIPVAAPETPDIVTLVSCPHFVTERMVLHDGGSYQPSGRQEVLVAIAGKGRIGEYDLQPGEALWVPAESPRLAVAGELTILRASVPR